MIKSFNNRFKLKFAAGTLFILLISSWFFSAATLYTDVEFFNKETLSRKGYRKWFYGSKTNVSLRMSPIERYLSDHHVPFNGESWIKVNGTSYSFFLQPIIRGHAYPKNKAYLIPFYLLEKWISKSKHEDILALHFDLARDNDSEIKKIIDDIWDMQ